MRTDVQTRLAELAKLPPSARPVVSVYLNTRWADDEGVHDLLALPGGLANWLTSAGLADTVEASPETLDALLVTRDALARGDADRLNETLRHGLHEVHHLTQLVTVLLDPLLLVRVLRDDRLRLTYLANLIE